MGNYRTAYLLYVARFFCAGSEGGQRTTHPCTHVRSKFYRRKLYIVLVFVDLTGEVQGSSSRPRKAFNLPSPCPPIPIASAYVVRDRQGLPDAPESNKHERSRATAADAGGRAGRVRALASAGLLARCGQDQNADGGTRGLPRRVGLLRQDSEV